MDNNLLYDREITCLYCGKKFKTKKVLNSKLVVKKRDPDFCMHYEGVNPYYYDISVCPHCSYAFSDSFSPIRKEYIDILEKEYRQKIGNIDLCGERNQQDALRSYKLALLCGNFVNEPRLVLAGVFLRIAWLYRFQGDTEEEKKYITKALEQYNFVYEHEDPNKAGLGEHRLWYLLGELSGATGNMEEARRWFNMVITEKAVEPSLKKMARERWEDYKNV